jgi:hypothetical protein
MGIDDKIALMRWMLNEMIQPTEIKAIERLVRSRALDQMAKRLMAKWHPQA